MHLYTCRGVSAHTLICGTHTSLSKLLRRYYYFYSFFFYYYYYFICFVQFLSRDCLAEKFCSNENMYYTSAYKTTRRCPLYPLFLYNIHPKSFEQIVLLGAEQTKKLDTIHTLYTQTHCNSSSPTKLVSIIFPFFAKKNYFHFLPL